MYDHTVPSGHSQQHLPCFQCFSLQYDLSQRLWWDSIQLLVTKRFDIIHIIDSRHLHSEGRILWLDHYSSMNSHSHDLQVQCGSNHKSVILWEKNSQGLSHSQQAVPFHFLYNICILGNSSLSSPNSLLFYALLQSVIQVTTCRSQIATLILMSKTVLESSLIPAMLHCGILYAICDIVESAMLNPTLTLNLDCNTTSLWKNGTGMRLCKRQWLPSLPFWREAHCYNISF